MVDEVWHAMQLKVLLVISIVRTTRQTDLEHSSLKEVSLAHATAAALNAGLLVPEGSVEIPKKLYLFFAQKT